MLKATATAIVDQQAQSHPQTSQVIDQLRPVLINNRRDSLMDNFSHTHLRSVKPATEIPPWEQRIMQKLQGEECLARRCRVDKRVGGSLRARSQWATRALVQPRLVGARDSGGFVQISVIRGSSPSPARHSYHNGLTVAQLPE